MSTAAPVFRGWDFEEVESKGKSPWKKSEPVEEDKLLEQALGSAREIVTKDFDEEEPAILSEALDRAEIFLRTQSREMKKRLGYFPPTPRISPGPNGSVDLHWEQPGWGLLVNVPPNDAQATFFGDCSGNSRIKGSLDPMSWNLGIVTWLSKQ